MKTFSDFLNEKDSKGSNELKELVIKDFENKSLKNNSFRDILYTGTVQIVNMSLKPGEEIGTESHDTDQFFIFFGDVEIVIDNAVTNLSKGDSILIPSGMEHNIINNSQTELKLFSVYGEPQH